MYIGGYNVIFKKEKILTRDSFDPVYSAFKIKIPLYIYYENKPLITVTLRDHKMEIIAVMEDNEWNINENNYFERNYDNSALEIIDKYGIPVLQVEIIGDKIIYINGLFFDEIGQTFLAYGTQGYAGYKLGEKSIDIFKERKIKITSIFKYPSEKYFGERLKKENDFAKSMRENYEGFSKISNKKFVKKVEVLCDSLTAFIKLAELSKDFGKNSIETYKDNYAVSAFLYREELISRLNYKNFKGEPIVFYLSPRNENEINVINNELKELLFTLKKRKQITLLNTPSFPHTVPYKNKTPLTV